MILPESQNEPRLSYRLGNLAFRARLRITAKWVILAASGVASAFAEGGLPSWEETAGVPESKTHVVPSLWAEMPRLKAKSTVTVLDVDGPGVVTQIHASALVASWGEGFDSPESQEVMIRVFYDGQSSPSINMPYMDFLGDIQCRSAYFTTVYFSKVKESHNFRLPMPFRKHIRIELENRSEKDLLGYADIQWEQVSSLPDNCGYLKTDYREAEINAQENTVLFEINRPAKVVAHWLQYESERSEKGETICEANQELYLDGDTTPTLNYLGSEDVYGYSWGYKGTHSDNYAAIIRQEELQPAGSRIAVLRCRTNDAISFQQSCKWILTFTKDPTHQKRLGDTLVPYRHCVYYYSVRWKEGGSR